jgi:hypothetical protein
MGNSVSINYMQYNVLDKEGKIKDSSYGFQVMDDYGTYTEDGYNSFSEVEERINQTNFLSVVNCLSQFEDMDENNCTGIKFNDKFYDWSELKNMSVNT